MSVNLLPRCKGTFRLEDRVLQRSRSTFALRWRVAIFLSVVLFYFTISVLNAQINIEEATRSSHKYSIPNKYGRKILSIPTSTTDDFEPTPYADLQSKISAKPGSQPNCTPPAILEFPPDGFTRAQRQQGWIAVHIVVTLYCFWLLAIICDDYFVPAIEQLCQNLNMEKDVVGATFMAAATSSPELFINCVGTFVTKGDIGVGTIVGSAVFNVLAVPACCGLFATQVHLDFWPITRDCLMYCVAVLALIGTVYDGKIMWFEALLLLVFYFLYITVMYYNNSMARTARKLISRYRRTIRKRPFQEVKELTPLLGGSNNNCSMGSCITLEAGQLDAVSFTSLNTEESDSMDSPWQRRDQHCCKYLLRFPLTLMLWLTIPDSRKHPGWKYATLFLAVAWIGVISYIVAFAVTIIGDTLNIPDSVTSLTVLAAGMSLPEAVSSIVVTKQGHGAMGISNSIGSNTFDILLCLALPWFIKAYFVPDAYSEPWVEINSNGLTYSVVFLLTTLFGLYIAFMANRFVLDWKIGVACALMYGSFLVAASMIELNVFFPVNPPVCPH